MQIHVTHVTDFAACLHSACLQCQLAGRVCVWDLKLHECCSVDVNQFSMLHLWTRQMQMAST